MKTTLAILTFLFSANVFAKTITLTCVMGDIGDMSIKIEDQGEGKEKLSVILTAMDGVTVRTYVNNNFLNQAASQGLKEGKIQAILSKTNLVASFGGAFLDAGVLELNRNRETQKNEVIFAAEGLVYVATCAQ
ncbi:MAG TPA: hypothetical protein VIG33_05590 [Pseudobdellovibrionaceae bacterium]|jgi:hypothetical protein